MKLRERDERLVDPGQREGMGWASESLSEPLAASIARGQEELTEFRPVLAQGRPSKIVCLGGGTGLPIVLKGLAQQAEPNGRHPGLDITAIVAMSDDGGSSGRLRRSRGLLPPGDVRNCLVALADRRSELCKIFQYRFGGGRGLAGHAVGNLLIAAMTELKGDFLEAVRLSAHLLNARGTVLPSTLAQVELVAEMDDRTRIVGERNLARAVGRVHRVELKPRLPPPSEGTLEAIAGADLISIGPGSLYSSILPNLLVDGVAAALRSTRALKVLIANLMTQPGETDRMSCADHVRALFGHVGPVADFVLINSTPPALDAIRRYAARGALPVQVNRADLLGTGVIAVDGDLLNRGARIRHDGRKVARCLLKLARSGE